MLALVQKGFSAAEVLAMSEPEAASLIEILTEKPPAKAESTKRFIARRKPKKAK